jgi:[NiFe] hydrogenase diaphorase moiety large subunit
MRRNVLEKIKKAELTGRGGACFPTAKKWEMVKCAKAMKKYVVCNGSEGEPGIKKDGFILNHFAEELIDGMKVAIRYIDSHKGYIYLNSRYYDKYNIKLRKLIDDFPIEVFRKPHSGGYVGGTETSVLNAIEGKKIEPRLRPPFPVTSGLWGYPTLVNNVETFYDVSLIMAEQYEKKRFYTVGGDCLWHGVYEFSESDTIEHILKETKNYPNFDFFVQVGGDASGEVLNSKQLKREVGGAGSITIHSLLKHEPMQLMQQWAKFFSKESCGQCTPCREGNYRLSILLNSNDPKWPVVVDVLDNLTATSFCGLGHAVQLPYLSYMKNVFSNIPESKLKMSKGAKNMILECFRKSHYQY